MKKTIATFLAVSALALSAQAQTIASGNTVKAVNGPLLLQGTNSSGVSTQSVSISNVGHIDARSANFNGADGVSANKLTMSNGGTISGTAQVVTIDAVGNGNVVIKDSTQVQGNITATGTISTSQIIQTTGTGSINSAYNLTAAGNKFNVAGDTGNVSTTGSVTATNIGTNSGKFYVNGTNGNTTVHGVSLLFGGAYVGPRADDPSLPALTVNGLGAFKGINNAGQKITGVGAGNVNATSTDAVNGSQLNTVVQNNTTTNARIDVTNDALATETTTRTAQVLDLEDRKADKVAVAAAISAEENARIAGDVAVLNSANNYTDGKIVNQSASDRAYTDKAVTGERDRAMAAEAALSKETKQVGAMAMAAAGVAGATPVGDKKTAATVALGSYSGQTAIAVGVSHLIKENTRVFGAFSKVTGGKTGVTVGASFSF